jgi:hypothetical protein
LNTILNSGGKGMPVSADDPVPSTTLYGAKGNVVTSNTTPVVGNFYAIHILVAATFSALGEHDSSGQAMTGFAIPANTWLYGKFTGYTLTSGTVRAYKA